MRNKLPNETVGQQITRLQLECWDIAFPNDCHREACYVLYMLLGSIPLEILNNPAFVHDLQAQRAWAARMRDITHYEREGLYADTDTKKG